MFYGYLHPAGRGIIDIEGYPLVKSSGKAVTDEAELRSFERLNFRYERWVFSRFLKCYYSKIKPFLFSNQ